MPGKYDIEAFADEQLGRSVDQILVALGWELARVDYKLHGTRRAQARKAGADVYRRVLAGLGFLLETGRRPKAADDPQFQQLRPLCEDLVDRRMLGPAALDPFEPMMLRKAAAGG